MRCGSFFAIAILASSAFVQAFENNYLYLQPNIGYADQPWKNTFGSFSYPSSTSHAKWHSGNGGFTYGFNIGYHAYKSLGIEAGGFVLPSAKLKTNNFQEYGFTRATFHAYDVYLALRALLPVTKRFQIFTKAGAHSKIITGSKKDLNKNWRYREPASVGPVFAAGLQYMLNDRVGFNLQYLYLGGKVNNFNALQNSKTEINPNTQIATFGMVYNIPLSQKSETKSN